MDPLYAPWRMQWVDRERPDDDGDSCTFCDLPARGNDRENRIVARSDAAYVLLNNLPYNPGHVMVIPYDHVADYQHLDEEVLFDCMRTSQRVMRAIDRSLSPDGFNVGLNLGEAGGASIDDHLHMHVVPRWNSDTSFMPLVANTAIVEEAVDETYERLREALLEDEAAESDGEGRAISL